MSPPTRPHDRWTEHSVPLVQEDGEAFGRYRVESSEEGFHLVDLTDRGGLGSCDCIDFQTRANPNYRRIFDSMAEGPLRHILAWIPFGPGRKGRSDCKHLEAAKVHFYLHVTVPMLHRLRHGVPTPPDE